MSLVGRVNPYVSPSQPLPISFWSGYSWEEALHLVEPVCHLTVENFREIVDFTYVVGPKADGERALLIGAWFTNDIFLLSMSGAVTRIDGTQTCSTLRGFILDVEVVCGPGGSQLVLAFDVLALHPETELLCAPKKIGCEQSSPIRVEKQIQSLLNKIATENFEKLSKQMCNILISNIDMCTLVANLVHKHAVSAPAFSDLYAKLCGRLIAKERIIHIIECNDDLLTGESDSVSYRWTNDVNANDAKILGPFENEQQCINTALSEVKVEPVNSSGTELTLHRLLIQRGIFIKIMYSRSHHKYYTVFFPVSKANECGQQMSQGTFGSKNEAILEAKKNTRSFKRSLLNMCEDEFKKQDIYSEWTLEKKGYEKMKVTLNDAERNKRAVELELRRMKIKKQLVRMIWVKNDQPDIKRKTVKCSFTSLLLSHLQLGNTRFIGELFKLRLLNSAILHLCFDSLLNIDNTLNFMNDDDIEINEEKHEAIFILFVTVGKDLDSSCTDPSQMSIYFNKIATLSNDKTHNSRIRFMYKNLIEIRARGWWWTPNDIHIPPDVAQHIDMYHGNGNHYSKMSGRVVDSTGLKNKMSYLERRQILSEIVDSVDMAGLLLKPISDSADAPFVWAGAQKLPYPIDGLVFTPACYRYGYPYFFQFKWKPPQKLTLDVALGNELIQEDERSLFRAHLSFSGYNECIQGFMDSSFSALEAHAPFSFAEEQGSSTNHPFALAVVKNSRNDVDCGQSKDTLAAKGERVGDDEEGNGVGSTCVSPDLSLIWVPHPYREWAMFRIAEVSFDTESGQLQFERLRPDKKVATSFKVANEIFHVKAQPLLLDEVALLLKRPGHSSVGENKYLKSYRADKSSGRSSFSTLRFMHSNIKRWLYGSFGGERIVDACAGGCHDLNNWITSGCHHVLALECDTKLIQEGKERLSQSSGHLRVELHETDLSKPLEHDIGIEFKHQSSAIFCHFGLHYFWQSASHTHHFLHNFAQFLSDGGFFVATVMRGDIFSSASYIRILNDSGATEFEATKINDHEADVFVSSIGKVHREAIINEEDAKLHFARIGLEHFATYPFCHLAQLFPTVQAALTEPEVKMSSLYTAFVFVKRNGNSCDVREARPRLFYVPDEVERQILLFLDVNDLVSKVRGLSRAARRCVDTLKIPDASLWFGSKDKKISSSEIRNRGWPSASVGLFLRMGGTIDDTVEDEDSLSFDIRSDIYVEDGSYDRDYSDNDSHYFHDYSDVDFHYYSGYNFGSRSYW
ncbi:hypothetical protein ACHAW6_011005 [Cyclotella cf. meneghiniana]